MIRSSLTVSDADVIEAVAQLDITAAWWADRASEWAFKGDLRQMSHCQDQADRIAGASARLLNALKSATIIERAA